MTPDYLINEDTAWSLAVPPPGRGMGLVRRDYGRHPIGCFAAAPAFPLGTIPRNEWMSRLKDRRQAAAQLSDARDRGDAGKPIPSRDQGQRGYCWAHSTTSASLLLRAAMNEPYSDLSAYMVACLIKQYRDEGGYGAQSVGFIAKYGIPTSHYWPQRSVDPRCDTHATWANAYHHRIARWIDFEPGNVDQLVTCLLLGIPVVSDMLHWPGGGHSVCTMQLERIDPADIWGSIRTRIWNSWGDSWGDNGTAIVEGRLCLPDGMVAPVVVTPSTD